MMQKPKLGTMRHRVIIQTRAVSQGGFSQNSHTDYGTVWAQIRPASGRESYVSGGIEHTVSHKITLRHIKDFDWTKGIRILFGNRYFRVHSAITPFEIPEFTIISVTEGVAT